MLADNTFTLHLKPPVKPRGRPTNFNHDRAILAALHVFWAQGYEGTSMADLTVALGMNKPSIYAAFGNKEALFNKAVSQYLSGPAAFISTALNEPTSLKVAKRYLVGAVTFFCNPNTPNGCMIVQSALACGHEKSTIQQLLVQYRKQFEHDLIKRLELAKTQDDLPSEASARELAQYLTTLYNGLSVQASSGATQSELLGVVKLALANWPAPKVN